MKKIVRGILYFFFLLCLLAVQKPVFAQAGGSNLSEPFSQSAPYDNQPPAEAVVGAGGQGARGGNPWNPCNDPLDKPCPIDGGVVALLAAGIAYGIKMARNSRKGVAG